jgi:hypothetical protein
VCVFVCCKSQKIIDMRIFEFHNQLAETHGDPRCLKMPLLSTELWPSSFCRTRSSLFLCGTQEHSRGRCTPHQLQYSAWRFAHSLKPRPFNRHGLRLSSLGVEIAVLLCGGGI